MKNIIDYALASILGICKGPLTGFIGGLQLTLCGNSCFVNGSFLACFWVGHIYVSHILLMKCAFTKFNDPYDLSKLIELAGIIGSIISLPVCLLAILLGIRGSYKL